MSTFAYTCTNGMSTFAYTCLMFSTLSIAFNQPGLVRSRNQYLQGMAEEWPGIELYRAELASNTV